MRRGARVFKFERLDEIIAIAVAAISEILHGLQQDEFGCDRHLRFGLGAVIDLNHRRKRTAHGRHDRRAQDANDGDGAEQREENVAAFIAAENFHPAVLVVFKVVSRAHLYCGLPRRRFTSIQIRIRLNAAFTFTKQAVRYFEDAKAFQKLNF